MTYITGHRYHLRDFRLEDLPQYQHWMQPGHQWQRLDGPYYPKPTPDEIQSTIQMIERKIKQGGWPDPRQRLVIADRESDQLAGLVTRYWISKETHWPAIGIVIFDPAHWGQGMGYEVFGLWCDYLFTQLESIVRLDLRTWSGNTGMMKLAEKLGFALEARFRMARIVDGAYYDGIGYGILRQEWHDRYPDGFVTSL